MVHLNGCAVAPIQVPVFQPMDLIVFVHVCAELITRTSPAELPTPVTFYLVIKCVWFYLVEAERFVFRILQVFLSIFPLVFY